MPPLCVLHGVQDCPDAVPLLSELVADTARRLIALTGRPLPPGGLRAIEVARIALGEDGPMPADLVAFAYEHRSQWSELGRHL